MVGPFRVPVGCVKRTRADAPFLASKGASREYA